MRRRRAAAGRREDLWELTKREPNDWEETCNLMRKGKKETENGSAPKEKAKGRDGLEAKTLPAFSRL